LLLPSDYHLALVVHGTFAVKKPQNPL